MTAKQDQPSDGPETVTELFARPLDAGTLPTSPRETAGEPTGEPTARLATNGAPPLPPDAEATVVPARAREARSPAGASTPPRRFGDYELLGELARGGMGVVYRARHVTLDRVVALKMILQGELASGEDVIRFRREAEAAAQLDHPGIVPIHEVGLLGGQHFFTMGFIEGQSLQQRVQRGPLAPREAADLVRKLADAIGYAHRQGVIHRDLKPANVLLDRQGEPRVTDFGLARKLENDSGLTRTGAIMGTPSYMPPEQASGQSAQVGPEADIYSLGGVLYCLLTGRPPFQAANPLETLRQVIEGDPLPPRTLNPAIDADLDAICRKCLEKRPGDRFASMEALHAELTRFLGGEALSIRTRSSLERLGRTLHHSRDDQELSTWGDLLLIFAPVVLVAELVISRLARAHALGALPTAFWWAGVVRLAEFGLLALSGWLLRGRILKSRRSITWHMWSHWAAFAIGCHLVLAVRGILHLAKQGSPPDLYDCYPFFAILTGVLWFTLGSNFWGGCYLLGGLHFVSALVIAAAPTSGPLVFGGLWFVSLVVTGLRLKRMQASLLAQESVRERS